MNDINFIRGALAVRAQNSVFALRLLAGNAGVGVHALEAFLRGKDLPCEVVHKLVGELFRGKKIWDETTQVLLDVARPAAVMPDTSQMLHRVVNNP